MPDDTFLPGILVLNGGLVVDRNKLKYQGDYPPHEGRTSGRRPFPYSCRDERGRRQSRGPMEPVEATAIAWGRTPPRSSRSRIPAIVFHSDGYLGRAESVLQNFEFGVYFGVQGLIDARHIPDR